MGSHTDHEAHAHRGELPIFDAQHEALEFVEAWQWRKHFKRCAHLSVSSNYAAKKEGPWYPHCQEDSFYRIKRRERSGSYSEDDVVYFMGCPPYCLLYKSERRGKVESIVTGVWQWISTTWSGIWAGFVQLSAWVQSIIVISLATVLIALFTGRPFWEIITLIANLLKNTPQ